MRIKIFRIFKYTLLSLVSLTVIYAIILCIYCIKEPQYRLPVVAQSGTAFIRNDMYGEGYYGAKRSNNREHSGVDFAAPLGAPVYASKSGIGIYKDIKRGYGKMVVIYHPNLDQTRYAHLSESNITKPQWVRAGEIIGYVGKTGNAQAKGIKPHVHFEIRKGGRPVDPMLHVEKE